MRKFSIPYNGDVKLLRNLFDTMPEIASQCVQIFIPILNNFAGTCRVIPQSEEYGDEIQNVILDAHKRGVRTNLLINPGCLGLRMATPDSIEELIEYLTFLVSAVSLDSVTIADFLFGKRN